jgi:hypothetical protein
MTYKSTGTITVTINWAVALKQKFVQAMMPWLQKHLSRRKNARNILVLMQNCVSSVQTVVLLHILGWSMSY